MSDTPEMDVDKANGAVRSLAEAAAKIAQRDQVPFAEMLWALCSVLHATATMNGVSVDAVKAQLDSFSEDEDKEPVRAGHVDLRGN